MMCCKAYP